MERCLASRRLYQGKILNLRVDEVELSSSGHRTSREVVEHRDAVGILARDDQGRFLLVRQFRYAIASELLEIPAGLIEPGEDPLASAQRELREETGYSARQWRKMPSLYTSPGFCEERLHLFGAWDLHWDPLDPDADESIVLERLTPDQARELLRSQEPQDAKTLAALGSFFAFGEMTGDFENPA